VRSFTVAGGSADVVYGGTNYRNGADHDHPTSGRILALGALALSTVAAGSIPNVAHAEGPPYCSPSCGNGPVLDCYLNGEWFPAGAVSIDGQGRALWCDGYNGHVEPIPVGLSHPAPSIQAGPAAAAAGGWIY
jgi:hypothetical protein